jgi:hypothetical protein
MTTNVGRKSSLSHSKNGYSLNSRNIGFVEQIQLDNDLIQSILEFLQQLQAAIRRNF